MSHTLHRQGCDESMRHDFVVLSRATRGINRDGSREKIRNYVKLAFRHNPVNIGNRKIGMILTATEDEMIERTEDGSGYNTVFAEKEDVAGFIKNLQEANYDLSVVCTGLESSVREICDDCGLKIHSANLSLGVYGKTELLPPPEIMEITTMCGHGIVSPYLVPYYLERIRAGKMTVQKAAVELAKPCVCGIFNTTRAEELLQQML